MEEMTLDELEKLSSNKIQKSILIQLSKFLDKSTLLNKIDKMGWIGDLINMIIVSVLTVVCCISIDSEWNSIYTGICAGAVIIYIVFMMFLIPICCNIGIKGINVWQYVMYPIEFFYVHKLKRSIGNLIKLFIFIDSSKTEYINDVLKFESQKLINNFKNLYLRLDYVLREEFTTFIELYISESIGISLKITNPIYSFVYFDALEELFIKRIEDEYYNYLTDFSEAEKNDLAWFDKPEHTSSDSKFQYMIEWNKFFRNYCSEKFVKSYIWNSNKYEQVNLKNYKNLPAIYTNKKYSKWFPTLKVLKTGDPKTKSGKLNWISEL